MSAEELVINVFSWNCQEDPSLETALLPWPMGLFLLCWWRATSVSSETHFLPH